MKKLYLLLTIMMFSLVGCSQEDDSIQTKSYTSKEQVNSIKISEVDANTKLTVSNDNDIHVKYWEGDHDKYKIEVENNKLLVEKVESNNEDLNLTDKTTEIQIPSKIYKNIDIKNLNGDIDVESIKGESMILYSTNGNIEVEKTNNDKLDIKSENGDISIDSIEGKDINLYDNNGNISGDINAKEDEFDIRSKVENGENNLVNQINNKDKKLTVQNNCGDVEIQFNFS